MNTDNIDLHVHSAYSDGTDEPAALIALAAETGLSAIALTDHDTVAGIDEFMAAAEEIPGLQAIPGVEISSHDNGREIHLVGLFVNHHSGVLLEFLDGIQRCRHNRNLQIAEKLDALGYRIDLKNLAVGSNTVVGRPHFAQALIEKYEFTTSGEVFDRLLKRGAPAYVPRYMPPTGEVIRFIHLAGGVAVWAHPIYRDQKERSWARRLLRKMVPEKLDAVEAYYSGFSDYQTQLMLEFAKEFDLAVSGGSDYHGGRYQEVKLGTGDGNLKVPKNLIPALLQRSQRYILAGA